MKKRLTTYFLLILMFGSGVQAQEFESATVAVKNMGVGCSFTTGTVPVVRKSSADGQRLPHLFDETFGVGRNSKSSQSCKGSFVRYGVTIGTIGQPFLRTGRSCMVKKRNM